MSYVSNLMRDKRVARHKTRTIEQSAKGALNGICYRGACSARPASWFNTSTRKYYCPGCAQDITSFTKRVDGFNICFPTRGSEDLDRQRKFGEEN